MIPPADMLCFALYSAGHAMQAAHAPLLAPLGLTYPQYLVLSALDAQDGQSVGGIGAQVQLDSSTLTPLLKRMEAAGWIARTRSAADERQVIVSLTAAGRDLAGRARDVPACFAARTGMDLPQITALRDTLLALRDRLRAA